MKPISREKQHTKNRICLQGGDGVSLALQMVEKFKTEILGEEYLVFDIEVFEDFFLENPLFEADLYIKKGKKLIFYRRKELPISIERISAWKAMGVKKVYVKIPSMDIYAEYLRPKLREVMESTEYPIEKKAKVLYRVAESILERAFRRWDKFAIENMWNFVKDTVRFLGEKPGLYKCLIELMDHDFSSYLHSNNTFFLATSFSLHKKMPLTEVELLAFSSIFHDIGKGRIPQSILQKPGPLDPYEWSEIKRHPLLSVKMLKERGFEDDSVLEIILEHHESPDGSGYPRGLKGEEVHPLSHILRVCDVFEALCGLRPYRPPYKPREAVRVMKEEMKGKLDERTFLEFLGFLGYEDKD
jgi:HD-GYP domain-containing protein (c-di-GMP phosphodiesterase class II)